MIKFPLNKACNVKSNKLPKMTTNQAYRSTNYNTPINNTDLVDLAKFNAETNNIGFFRKLAKTVKLFIQSNFRSE